MLLGVIQLKVTIIYLIEDKQLILLIGLALVVIERFLTREHILVDS